MPSALVATLAALVAGAITWLLCSRRTALLEERLRWHTTEVSRLSAETTRLDQALTESRTALARAAADLARVESERDAQRRALEEAEAKLGAAFQGLAAEALRTSREDFLQLAKQSFAQHSQAAGQDLDQRQQAVAALVAPLRESLAQVDTRVAELEQSRARAYGQLGEQLSQLQAAQLRLQAETSRLATALSTTRTAGTWGEVQLRRVVELAGMVEHCDFVEQRSPGDGARDRADLIVHLPGGQQIAVDAKAPTESYREAATETDPERRATRLAEHAARVRSHVDALGSREYWAKYTPSPEFVVLFLPGDSFLTAALEGDPALLDRAIGRKVLLATPTTLIALLKAAAYGWRQEAVAEHAERISELGRELHDRCATFADHLEKVGRGLDTAVRGYNQAVGSFESSLLSGARRLAELGAKGTKDLSSPPPVDSGLREVSRRT